MAQYTARRLSDADTGALFELFEIVRTGMPPKQRQFMRWRTIEELGAILRDENVTYTGLFNPQNSELVGAGKIVYARSSAKLLDEYPTKRQQNLTDWVSPEFPIAALSGGMLHPNHRKKGLGGALVRYRLKTIQSYAKDSLDSQDMAGVSITDIRNFDIFRPLFDNGFRIIERGVDPTDNGPIYFWYRDPNNSEQYGRRFTGREEVVPRSNTKKISRLLDSGYEGRYLSKRNSVDYMTLTRLFGR